MPFPFLGLQASEDPMVFRLPVRPALETPGHFLFGGAGLGACAEAMERATRRPVVWATAQYLSYASSPSVMEIRVDEAVRGHHLSQVRATGWVEDREILTVNAALGSRPSLEGEGSWAERPVVPPPEDCPQRPTPTEFAGTIMEHTEARVARGRDLDELDGTVGDGRYAVWWRFPGIRTQSVATLAIFGDHVPGAMGQALGQPGGGNSLDNTLRVGKIVDTEWVLCDIRVHAVRNGFGHGTAHLWAEDGTLLGTASQSVIVRFWRPGSTPTPRERPRGDAR